MQFVSAGLGLRGHQTGDCLTLLSIVKLRPDGSLGHSVQVGVDYDDTQNGILVIGSVQLEAGAAEMLAVDKNLQTALRILSRCVVPAGQLLGAGRQQLKRGEVAFVDRQVLHVALIIGNANVRVLGL